MERIVCLLILLSFKLIAQDKFIFWVEPSNKNLILSHQSQNLSPAMTRSENTISGFACEISHTDDDLRKLPRTESDVIDDDMSKTIKFGLLNAHKDELSDCFMGVRISVGDIIKTDLLKAQNETYVKVLPLCFSVEFGERNTLIHYLKKK